MLAVDKTSSIEDKAGVAGVAGAFAIEGTDDDWGDFEGAPAVEEEKAFSSEATPAATAADAARGAPAVVPAPPAAAARAAVPAAAGGEGEVGGGSGAAAGAAAEGDLINLLEFSDAVLAVGEGAPALKAAAEDEVIRLEAAYTSSFRPHTL
jgi:hypothetical protein